MNSSGFVPLQMIVSQGVASSGNAIPMLHQIAAMVEALGVSGENNSIDLCHAPLSSADYGMLKDVLGEGKVSAEIEALGPTHIRETAISGVWWITHRNQEGAILGEFIEVAMCPEIFKTDPQDVPSGLRLLRERLSQKTFVKNPSDLARASEALGISKDYQ